MSKGAKVVDLFNTIDFRFQAFHDSHPEVYHELVAMARDLRNRGFDRYGIKTLIEVVRWNRRTSGPDSRGFKLNNDFSSRYARLIEANVPELVGFFETRVLRAA